MGRNKTPYLFAPSEEVPEPAGRPEAAGNTRAESGGTSLAHCISKNASQKAAQRRSPEPGLLPGHLLQALCVNLGISILKPV